MSASTPHICPQTGRCKKCYKKEWNLKNRGRVRKLAQERGPRNNAIRRKRYETDPDYRNKQKARSGIFRDANKKQISAARIEKYMTDTKHRQKALDRASVRRNKNPIAIKNDQLLRNYGIGLDEYYSMLKAQGGGCAICGATVPESKRVKFFHVDHNHNTGKVRGLLCSRCNKGLGAFRDAAALLSVAISYLNTYDRFGVGP